MEIRKSSRHSRIIGNFGESLICNMLSRSGFETALVDHTGIDIIAYNPSTEQRLGITVKSRTRNPGKEETHVNILSYRKGKNDRQRLLDASVAFNCDPWVAVYVETAEHADLYLTSLKHYDERYRSRTDKAIDDWKMGKQYKETYSHDPDVKHVEINFNPTNWDWKS